MNFTQLHLRCKSKSLSSFSFMEYDWSTMSRQCVVLLIELSWNWEFARALLLWPWQDPFAPPLPRLVFNRKARRATGWHLSDRLSGILGPRFWHFIFHIFHQSCFLSWLGKNVCDPVYWLFKQVYKLSKTDTTYPKMKMSLEKFLLSY